MGYHARVEVSWTDCSSGDRYFTNPGPVFMSRTKLYKRVSIKSKCKKKTNPRRNLLTLETPRTFLPNKITVWKCCFFWFLKIRENWGNL